MSDGITAMWDDANEYEWLAEHYKVPVRLDRDGGMWPYHMDSKHYEVLKKQYRLDRASSPGDKY
jgi:hypothetical protein